MTTPAPLDADLLARLRAFFRREGAAAYLVGGSVRDGLLGRGGRVPGDLDLVITQGDAPALTRRFAGEIGWSYVPLHEAYPVGRAVLPGSPAHSDGTLDIASAEQGLRADLLRRDFTVNALAVPLEAFTGDWSAAPVIDLVGGRADLAARTLRATHPGVFRDDPLRAMRAVRLAAELDFAIAPETAALIRRDAPLVRRAAGERVRDELLRMLAAPSVLRSLGLFDDLGLLHAVLPELAVGRGVTQPKEHHYDVLGHNLHTAATIEGLLGRTPEPLDQPAALALTPWRPELEGYFSEIVGGGQTRGVLLRLTGLLHDVAKPQTKGPDATGRIRFLGHSELGAEIAGRALTRLRFGAKEIRHIERMIELHLRPGQLQGQNELPTSRAIYRYLRDAGSVALDTLYLNLADHLAARGPQLSIAGWQDHCAVAALVLERAFAEQTAPPPRLVTGDDVMACFGLPPGRQVGRLVELAREAQAAGEVTSRAEALDLIGRRLEADGRQDRVPGGED